MVQPGTLGGSAKFGAHRIPGEAFAVMGEQELCWPPGSCMRDGPAAGSGFDDLIDDGEDVVIEWHHPFGVEFSQRNFQPRTLAGDFMDAVEFQI